MQDSFFWVPAGPTLKGQAERLSVTQVVAVMIPVATGVTPGQLSGHFSSTIFFHLRNF